MITGMHAIVFSSQTDKVRAFFADVLGLPSVDAGGGWLIFALPPAELAVHPANGESHHELYLMCDDIHGTLAELRGKGAEVAREVSDQGWGLLRASNTQPVLVMRWRCYERAVTPMQHGARVAVATGANQVPLLSPKRWTGATHIRS